MQVQDRKTARAHIIPSLISGIAFIEGALITVAGALKGENDRGSYCHDLPKESCDGGYRREKRSRWATEDSQCPCVMGLKVGKRDGECNIGQKGAHNLKRWSPF